MAICKYSRSTVKESGFSLIEVMVAIVVLATGILALTVLQLSMTRAATAAKTESFAMGYAQQELERLRGQAGSLAGYTSLTDTALVAIAGSGAVTGTDFFKTVDVKRYVTSTATPFSVAVPGFALNTTSDVTSPDPLISVPEYKQIQVDVSWTGADAVAHRVRAFDIVDELAFSGSTNLLADADSGGGGSPIIIQSKSTTGMDGTGVIPIATGGAAGEATAASNPKPLVDNSTGTAATSFNVLTYLDLSTPNIKLQREIETQMLSCKCHFTATSSTNVLDSSAMRPTAWDGSFYASPITVLVSEITGVPASSKAASEVYSSTVRGRPAVVSRDINQSELCDSCCRDHHDPSSVTETQDKFDPYRTTGVNHDHYRYPLDTLGNPTSSPVLITSASDDVDGAKPIYVEACRMIRVDGLWRTATDVNMEHMGLLATNQTTTTSGSPAVTTYAWGPTASAITRYANFVKSFLAQRVIDTSVTPNTATAGTLSGSDVTSLETANTLNSPATIAIATSTSTKKYLHDRGLYLDYLNPTAVTYLNQLLKDCPVTSPATPKINCLLANLPFVTINTTELAFWTSTPTGPAKINVTNNALDNDVIGEPQRGVTQPVGVRVDGETATGYPNMYRSNSGLVFALPIDPFDGMVNPAPAPDPPGTLYHPAQKVADAQDFQFSNSGMVDADSDGIADESDNCPSTANPSQVNSDGDALGDACDTDDDNDTILDAAPDNCLIVRNTDQLDGDGDAIGNLCDNCPADSNASQLDTDLDGTGDACDTDDDNDGVLDSAPDNCPLIANADQRDADSDGLGDACDASTNPDTDGDGIVDSVDNCPGTANGPSLGALSQLDSDGDGTGDACDLVTTYPSLTYGAKLSVAAGGQLFPSSSPPSTSWAISPANPANTPSSGTCVRTSADGATPVVYSCAGTRSVTQDLKFTRYNRFTLGTAPVYPASDKDSTNNPCRILISTSPNKYTGSQVLKPAICNLYNLSSVTRTRAASTSAVTATPGESSQGIWSPTTANTAAVASAVPTEASTINLTGIEAGDAYNATWTHSTIDLTVSGRTGTYYTCSAGEPVYILSACQ